jgi:O-antigen/teichoic acid export membrane protein
MKRISLTSLLLWIPPGFRDYVTEIARDKLTGRVIRGSFWAVAGSLIFKGFFLVSSIVLARILGRSQYGELGIIQSTINMFASFAGFGLGVTSTKYVAEMRDVNPEKTGNFIASSNIVSALIGFCFTAFFIILSPIIAERLIDAPDLADEMRLGSLMLFFSAINGAQSGAMAGFENFKDIAKINIFVGLFCLPVQILLTINFGLNGAIAGFGLTYFFQWILNYFFLRKTANRFKIRIRIRESLKDISYLWEFSIPALLGGIIVSISLWYANTILVTRVDGFNEMAVFNAASQWQNIVLFIPLAISQISLPIFSHSKNNIEKFIKFIKYNIIMNLSICLILAIIFALFSKFIMQSYGNSFREGYIVLIILTFTAVFISLNTVIGQVIAGIGKMWVGFIINLLWAVVFLYLAFQFISSGAGAKGLAMAMLFSYLVHTMVVTLTSYYFVNRRFGK